MKKAFTLIELLAVIIILAIVALIATPLILNVINDSRRSANLSEAYLILNGAENYYASSLLDDNLTDKLDGKNNVYPDINYSGEKPESGYIFIKPNGDIAMAVYNDSICYTKSFIKTTINEVEGLTDTACKLDVDGNPPVGGDTGVNPPEETKPDVVVTDPDTGTSIVNPGTNDGSIGDIYDIYTVGYITDVNADGITYSFHINLEGIDYENETLIVSGTPQVMSTQDDFNKYFELKGKGTIPSNNSNTANATALEMFTYSMKEANLKIDSVDISCDTTKCTATIVETFSNLSSLGKHNTTSVGGSDITGAIYNGIKFNVKIVEVENLMVSGLEFATITDNMVDLSSIETITFDYGISPEYYNLTADKQYDFSEAQNKSIVGWVNNGVFHIQSNENIIAPISLDYMFSSFVVSSMLTEIQMNNIYTSKTNSMQGLFTALTSLTSISFGENFDTREVNNMIGMFEGLIFLESLDLGTMFDISKTEDYYTEDYNGVNGNFAMFRGTSIAIPGTLEIKIASEYIDSIKAVFEGVNAVYIPY